MIVLALVGILMAFYASYMWPRESGWLLVLVFPLLGPAEFTFVPAESFPLTIQRLCLFASFGMFFSPHVKSNLMIFKSNLVRLVLLFLLILSISSIRDFNQTFFFNFIPRWIFPLFLAFFLIESEKDLDKVLKIFVIHALMISGFSILEFFTDFNIHNILAESVPQYDFDYQVSKENPYLRFGIYRSSGIDGNSVMTGYRLAFYFPLLLFYCKKWPYVLRVAGLVVFFVGLVFLQSRAATAIIVLTGVFIFLKGAKDVRVFVMRLFSVLFSATILLLTVYWVFPDIFTIYEAYTELAVAGDQESISSDGRFVWMAEAFHLFLQNPFFGYGSPQHVYLELMETKDIPSYLTYFLAGGIIGGGLFLYIMYYMIRQVYRIHLLQDESNYQKEFLFYATLGIAGAFLPTFLNWQENHFTIMLFLYVAVYKVYVNSEVAEKSKASTIEE